MLVKFGNCWVKPEQVVAIIETVYFDGATITLVKSADGTGIYTDRSCDEVAQEINRQLGKEDE